MSQTPLPRQPEVNIGSLGHVENGKSTLVQALTGIWTARHSEEIRRGITIRIGYADAGFYRCPRCGTYGTAEVCAKCQSQAEFQRAVSFVDCPGHHSLMVTMLSGAALMDGALLVLSATEKCPQPQDREHLAAAQIVGINRIVVVQNKIDVVSRERIIQNYQEIREFLKGTNAENSPIIPLSAQRRVNIDALIGAIQEYIPTPPRDLSKPPLMSVLRSFDVNRPGTPALKLQGGVVGGSILQGKLRVGDEVEIRPGIHVEKGGRLLYKPLFTTITSLQAGGRTVEEAAPGGLIGMGTLLDPAITKADNLVGNVVGHPGKLPPVLEHIVMEVQLFERVVGTDTQTATEKIKMNEPLVLNIGGAVSSGTVTSTRNSLVEVALRRPVCAELGSRVALSRRIGDSWRLIGFGISTKQ
ncbi:MAG: translation initiation factor IF-2 subunit gamma [Candidatus Bathyarchaeia archaeon]